MIFKYISNFNNVNDYLPILNGCICSDIIIIFLLYNGVFNSIFLSIDEGDRHEDDMFMQIEDKSEPYNQELLNMYLDSLLKMHLTDKEYHVLRLSYGLDCDKQSAKEIAKYLDIEGAGAYVRVSQLKKQAVAKLIENVDHSQVFEYL